MTDTPAWFTDAIDATPERIRVDAAGASINALVWGDAGKPGIVLIHGGAAHAHWWSHIAPAFLPDYRVVALDLSGHGDSDRRERYGLDLWTDEVIAVIDAAEFASEPVVVGHSMGGFVTIATAARHNERLGGAVIIDSPVVKIDPEVEQARRTNDGALERGVGQADADAAADGRDQVEKRKPQRAQLAFENRPDPNQRHRVHRDVQAGDVHQVAVHER